MFIEKTVNLTEGLGVTLIPPFNLSRMIHFNELYISEDDDKLVIDVSIDEDPVYNGCYIDKITVTLKDDCDDDTKSKVVYTNGNNDGITYVDINGDGVIDYVDITIINWLQDLLINSYVKSSDLEKYDFNKDGFVDFRDLEEILTATLQSSTDPKYDLDNNGSFTDIRDLNIFIDFMLSMFRNAGIDINDTSLVMYIITKYQELMNNPNAEKLVVNTGKRRVRLCLPSLKQPLDMVSDSLSEHLFLVTVEAGTPGDSSYYAKFGCGWDQDVIRGFAYDTKRIYDTAISYASSYGDSCDNNDSSAFMDFILRYYAFLYAVKCGDIEQACYYWNNYMKHNNTKKMSAGGGCSCHGAFR